MARASIGWWSVATATWCQFAGWVSQRANPARCPFTPFTRVVLIGRSRTGEVIMPTTPSHPLAAAMSEAQLLATILQACRKLGLLCYHTYDSRRSEPGFP